MRSWQERENQEFMREYEEQQAEREAIRQRNMPKFDPENPKAYLEAVESDGGGMGGEVERVCAQVDGLLTPAVLAHIIRNQLYTPPRA